MDYIMDWIGPKAVTTDTHTNNFHHLGENRSSQTSQESSTSNSFPQKSYTNKSKCRPREASLSPCNPIRTLCRVAPLFQGLLPQKLKEYISNIYNTSNKHLSDEEQNQSHTVRTYDQDYFIFTPLLLASNQMPTNSDNEMEAWTTVKL